MSKQNKRRMKFTREMKKNWLEALRSGEYKKGEGLFYSHIGDCYCALGVLCMVVDELRSPRPDGHEDYLGVKNLIGNTNMKAVYVINDNFSSLKPQDVNFEQVALFVEGIKTAEPYEEMVEFRHNQGLSIREVAKEAGLSKSTLHRLENGVTVGRVHWEKLNQYYKTLSKKS